MNLMHFEYLQIKAKRKIQNESKFINLYEFVLVWREKNLEIDRRKNQICHLNGRITTNWFHKAIEQLKFVIWIDTKNNISISYSW